MKASGLNMKHNKPSAAPRLLAFGLGSAMALAASSAVAQTSGPLVFYGQEKSSYTYESIDDKNLTGDFVASGTCRPSRVDIPFDFEYLGVEYDELWVNCAGYVTFGSRGTSFYNSVCVSCGDGIPVDDADNQMVALFWNDIQSARIESAVEGTAPSRILHIEFQDFNIRFNATGDDGNMMLSLYEADGSFEVSWDGEIGSTSTFFGDEGLTGYEASGDEDDFWDHFDPCTEQGDCTPTVYNNDLAGNRVRVSKAEDPELRIEINDFPRGALPGNTVTGTLTLVNLGQDSASDVDARLYLSDDDQLDTATDTLLGTFEDLVATLPNGKTDASVSFTLPSSVQRDQTFHLIAEIDQNDEFDEIIEDDNTFVTDGDVFGTGYDVEISGCRLVDPASGINPGQTGTFAVTISNLGAPYEGENGDLDVQLVGSQDTVPDMADPSLGTSSVPTSQLQAANEYTVEVDGTLPSGGVPPGLYYPICRLDPMNNISELNGNTVNIYVGTDEERFQSGADFTPSNVTFNSEVPMGTPLDIAVTVDSVAVPTIRNVDVNIYASQDDQFDPGGADFLLGTVTARFEDTQTTRVVVEESLQLPSDLPGGRWRVFVQSDPTARIVEVSESNNLLLSGTVDGSTFEFLNAIDFAVQNVRATPTGTLQAGDTIEVDFTVVSDGLRFDGFVPYTVFASPGDEFNFGDFVIGTGRVFIPAASSNQVSVNATAEILLDANLPPGAYNVSVVIDPNDAFLEATEANNADIDTTPNPVIELRGADLIVDSLVTQRFAFASTDMNESTITAEMVVENIGQIDADGWRYVYVWSDDPNIRIDDPVVFTSNPRSLEADGNITFVDEVPVPVRTSTDALFLGVVVDYFNEIPDRARQNNQRISAITDGPVPVESQEQEVIGRTAVTIVQPAPDYQVRVIVTGTTAAGGEELAVTRSIGNVGNAIGLNAAYAYYLSENSVISPDDDVQLRAVGTTSQVVNVEEETGFFRTDLVVDSDDISADFVRVPENIEAGTYFLGMVANPGLEQREVFVANNVDVFGEPVTVDGASIQFSTRSFPRATSGVPYEVGVFARGGAQPIEWELAPGSSLPPGLTLDRESGIIEGTPTEEGRFDFTLRALSGTAFADRPFFIIVTPPTVSLEVVTRSLPSGVANRGYDVQVIAIGGAPPYTWELRNPDDLPEGLTFDENGRLSGTPVAPDSTSLLLRVTDSLDTEASRELPIRILNPNQTVQIQNTQVPDFRLGEEFPCEEGEDRPPFRFAAEGGLPEYRWSLAQGSEAPPGLELRADGTLCGTPTQVGIFPVEIRVQDQFDPMNPDASREGLFDTALFIVEIEGDNSLGIVGVGLEDAVRGEAYSASLEAVGGTMPYTWRLVEEVSDLPDGLTLTEAGVLEGTPTEAGEFGFQAEVQDQDGQIDRQPFQLSVAFEAPFCERPENAEAAICAPADDGGCTSVSVRSGPLGWGSMLMGVGLVWALRRRRREDAPTA
ncbi:MAG TPA: putative Ig domain-containing protein [Myxococcales bacterium LLY-WYZ-16_1]|nr:putative Ig domain-containing protein [Myxococcales bacterium LLY-WYZ-16_1]